MTMRLTSFIFRTGIAVSVFASILSCTRYEPGLEQALALAGDNRIELEKVLTKYSADPADSLKYRAAVFLIENMPGHGYYRGKQLDRFLEYYPLLKEVRSRKGSPDEAVDSIRRKYGTFDISALGYYEDIRTVDSAYLCDNIEWAFKVWLEQPWGINVDFNDFCEYILPHRVGTETPVRWREDYYDRYNHLLDDFRSPDNPDRTDPAAAAKCITDSLTGPGKINFTSATPAPGLLDFDLYLCRALGIPAASDYMPFRGEDNVEPP